MPIAGPSKCHPERVAYSRGLCRRCYDRERDERRPDLLQKRRERQRAYGARWYRENRLEHLDKSRDRYFSEPPEKRRARALWERYRLTEDDYARLLKLQRGVCAICRRSPRGATKASILHVDHCHKTRRVRGLLCSGCNTSLGQFMHSRDVLQRAIDYLEGAR